MNKKSLNIQEQYDEEDKKILKRWFIHNNLSQHTRRVYLNTIRHYVKATGMSVKELYDEAIEDEDAHVPIYRKRVNNHLLEFQYYLDEQNLKENTKSKHIHVISSFYSSLGIQFQKIRKNYSSEPEIENTEKLLTKEIIQVMMKNASIRDKGMISFMALTGQAQNEVRNITIQNILDSYNTELIDNPIFSVDDLFDREKEVLSYTCTRLNMYRQKTNYRYWTYLPSECSQYLIQYLHEREEGKNTKIRIKDNNDSFFVTKQGNRYAISGVGKIITSIGDRSGLEHPENFNPKTRKLLIRNKGYHRVFKSHNLRKYFINTCRRYAGTTRETNTSVIFSGLELANFWTGHKLKGAIKYYVQYNDDDYRDMKAQYEQALPYLSLETRIRSFDTKERKEFEDLKKDYASLQKEVEDLKEFLKYNSILEKL